MNKADQTMKNVAEEIERLLKDLDILNGISQGEKDRLNSLGFNMVINTDRENMEVLRRELDSAISDEKFVEGFMVAMKLVGMLGQRKGE